MVTTGATLSIIALLAVSLTTVNAQDLTSVASCDALSSCSPTDCEANSESDCSLSVGPFDYASDVASLACNSQCSQSTSDICTSLATKLKKNQGVIAAYCTDQFLVIWATGLPGYDAATYLKDIPLPPGGDGKCRVRSASAQRNVYKIPLNPVKRTSGSNTVVNPLPGVPGMPSAGAIGVAISGVPIFPNYNNRGLPAWVSCELDRCSAHSGRGDDYHYHGDPFGAKCLYSEADYFSDTAHPPLVGISLDGYMIYGRYTKTTQDGAGVGLDECGGHEDSTLGYHYHPQVETGISTSSLDGVRATGPFTYTAYRVAPTTCWRGDVDQVSNFWGSNQANYDRSKSKQLSSESDYDLLRPCCGTSQFIASDGIAIDGASCASGADCSAGSLNSDVSSTTGGSGQSGVGTPSTSGGAGANPPQPSAAARLPSLPACLVMVLLGWVAAAARQW
uniref:YHYH domain-containing protein n=1 Tax=Hemiselmis andersenii TaxID=464988 RepID=A0A6U2AEM6_HEMAN|mmetsp:Transcript_1118/g.2620  ORF Transcript_1118/g.2620 Transcript_1118/m.2620 type:complete len:448 (+) Transcript_1118:161-1504(+)